MGKKTCRVTPPFAPEAAATNGQNNKGPAGLVERPADLKERTGELPPVDIEMAAEELKKPLTKN